ncbi:MAG: hypothetical protein WHT06_03150, partial [Desulfobacterales bacterium]
MDPNPPPLPPPFRRRLQKRIETLGRRRGELSLWQVPDRFGRAGSLLLRLFFSGVRFEEAQQTLLRRIPSEALVVFLDTEASTFSLLFACTRFGELGLPVPRLVLGPAVGPVGRVFGLRRLDEAPRRLDPAHGEEGRGQGLPERLARAPAVFVSLARPRPRFRRRR